MLPFPADQGPQWPDRRTHSRPRPTMQPSRLDSNAAEPVAGPIGLYAITPDLADPAVLLPKIERALEGGIDALQFRVKRGSPDDPLRTVQALRDSAVDRNRRCAYWRLPLLVNLVVELDCDIASWVRHVGRSDGDP